jgi:hypothetical protein
MELIVTAAYELNELSEPAQNKAYEAFIYSHEYDYEIIEIEQTLKAFCDIFSINWKNFDFSQHCYIDYVINLDENILNLKGKRLISYIWNNYHSDLFKGKYLKSKTFEAIPATKHKYQHFKLSRRNENVYYWCTYRSNINLENEAVLTGNYLDMDILEPIYKILREYDQNTTFEELMDKCLNNFLSQCNINYEYYYSFDNFAELSDINEYRYNEQGKLI